MLSLRALANCVQRKDWKPRDLSRSRYLPLGMGWLGVARARRSVVPREIVAACAESFAYSFLLQHIRCGLSTGGDSGRSGRRDAACDRARADGTGSIRPARRRAFARLRLAAWRPFADRARRTGAACG